jgi:hypothetical protein
MQRIFKLITYVLKGVEKQKKKLEHKKGRKSKKKNGNQ